MPAKVSPQARAASRQKRSTGSGSVHLAIRRLAPAVDGVAAEVEVLLGRHDGHARDDLLPHQHDPQVVARDPLLEDDRRGGDVLEPLERLARPASG